MTTSPLPVLVTGASSGIGLLASVELARRGYQVIGTMRDPGKAAKLRAAAKAAGVAVDVVALDVTSGSSIEACARDVLSRYGPLFGLVNNAGVGIGGFFEDMTSEEIRQVLETNFFGVLAVTRAFVGGMREARRGRIVNVSSLGGRVANPGMTAYISSKFALEGFSESLRYELAPFGVGVVLVEPGMFRTEIFESNLTLCKGAENEQSPYHRRSRQMLEMVKKQYAARAGDAAVVARTIAGALDHPSPGLRYPVGKDAWIAILLKWLLPERLFLGLVSLASGREE